MPRLKNCLGTWSCWPSRWRRRECSSCGPALPPVGAAARPHHAGRQRRRRRDRGIVPAVPRILPVGGDDLGRPAPRHGAGAAGGIQLRTGRGADAGRRLSRSGPAHPSSHRNGIHRHERVRAKPDRHGVQFCGGPDRGCACSPACWKRASGGSSASIASSRPGGCTGCISRDIDLLFN